MTASAIFQCVWPIVDETRSWTELITEAIEDLEQVADRAHALITGPPWWSVLPAAEVVGWKAYAPGLVLLCRAPAEDVRAAPLRRRDVDESEVLACLEADQAPRRPADRAEAVRHLFVIDGLNKRQVAERLEMTVDAVDRSLIRTKRRQRNEVAS